jgi:hypothetical protein
MKNNRELHNEVHAHILMNPPTEFRSNTVDITIQNSKEFALIKKADNSETQYDLLIPNPKNSGLPSTAQPIVNNFLADVVLALNLELDVGALMMNGRSVSTYNWVDKPHEQAPAESAAENATGFVCRSEDGTHMDFRVNDKVEIVAETRSHVRSITHESIDENELIDTLKLVTKADRHKALTNLGKALDSFEAAMSEINLLFIFKHLYNSLELAVNSDGIDRKRSALAAETQRLTQVQKTTVLEWPLSTLD